VRSRNRSSIKRSEFYFPNSKTQESTTSKISKPSYKLHLEVLENRLAPATIAVTTSADDLISNDGSVSLREAITSINAGNSLGDPDITAQNPGTFGSNDMIQFKIPGTGVQTIAPTSALPLITKTVKIDGRSEGVFQGTPGYSGPPLIDLSGAVSGSNANGLVIETSNSSVDGLIINNYRQGDGLQITGASATGNSIFGNYFGTNPAGTAAQSNLEGLAIMG